MERYLVFSYPSFYPGGGMADFVRDFSTQEEAIDFCIHLPDREEYGDNEHIDILDQRERVLYRLDTNSKILTEISSYK
jgi:hypothetical protein